MISIKWFDLDAIMKLSSIKELWMANTNTGKFQKVEVFGMNDQYIGLKPVASDLEKSHTIIYMLEKFKGISPLSVFLADDIWGEIFEDLK